MFDTKLTKALNDQLNEELFSGYIYWSMAGYCEREGFPGFAHWLELQAQEELDHAFRFYNFLNERGGKVELQEIGKPPRDFDSLLDVFEQALDHEKKLHR